MRAWNMTVQWWLVVNVHRRFPVKPLRTVVTMLISAFWHGVHSGYYLSMLTVPFILVAEDAIKKKLRPIVVSYFYRIFWLVASNKFSFFSFPEPKDLQLRNGIHENTMVLLHGMTAIFTY
jgi:hypothetical protein